MVRHSAPCEPTGVALAAWHARRQVAIAIEIGRQSNKHEDRGDPEADVPAVELREKAADQGSGDGAEIDRHAEDRKAARAPGFVVQRIERAHLRRDVALEKTGADDEQQ